MFIAVLFFAGLFLCVPVSQIFSQDGPSNDSVVTNEIRDSAGNTVVAAKTEEVTDDTGDDVADDGTGKVISANQDDEEESDMAADETKE